MSDFFNSLKGFKTVIVQGIVALIGVLIALGVIPASEAAGYSSEAVSQNFDLILGGALALVAAINTVLRFATSTPIGKKQPTVGGAG